MIMRCRAALLACSLLPLPVAAQRTWIVDAANGPGTDFTDVPLAVQAASHGDTLIVRSGNYTTATTNKGISLIGEAGASFTLSQQVLPFVVRFLPAGRTFVLKGFTVTQPSQS